MNREKFFDAIRAAIGPLDQAFVDGTEALLDEGEGRKMMLEQQAYIMATAYHETAATMQPIAEYGHGEGHEYGEPCAEHGGQIPYGRGFVQLTWCDNYVKADTELGLHGTLVDDFDLALDMGIAAQIIFQGMIEGWFTGAKLDDYITDDVVDYINARRIVNGTDRAEQIAHYATAIETELELCGWLAEAPTPPADLDEALTEQQIVLHGVIAALEDMKGAGGGQRSRKIRSC